MEEYEKKTGAKVFLQPQYTGPNKNISYSYGTPFAVLGNEGSGGRTSATPLTKEDLSVAVHEALSPLIREMSSATSSSQGQVSNENYLTK